MGSVPLSCGSYGGLGLVELRRVELCYVKAVKVGCGLHRLVKFGFVQAVRLSCVELRNVVDRQGSCGERRTNEEIFLE